MLTPRTLAASSAWGIAGWSTPEETGNSGLSCWTKAAPP